MSPPLTSWMTSTGRSSMLTDGNPVRHLNSCLICAGKEIAPSILARILDVILALFFTHFVPPCECFRGRPPNLPFLRAAAALALDLTEPPCLPRTAAIFESCFLSTLAFIPNAWV